MQTIKTEEAIARDQVIAQLKATKLSYEDMQNILVTWCQFIDPINYVDWSTGDRQECLDNALDFGVLDNRINLDGNYANNNYNMGLIRLATQGDYCGTLVEKSNIKHMVNKYIDEGIPGIYEVTLSFGTSAIALDLRVLTEDPECPYYEYYEELREDLGGLSNYPLFDEDLLYEIEEEAKHENWETWIEYDLIRALESSFDPIEEDDIDFEDVLFDNIVANEKLKEFYFNLEDGCNFVWENEAADTYQISTIDNIIDHLTEQPDLLASIGLKNIPKGE